MRGRGKSWVLIGRRELEPPSPGAEQTAGGAVEPILFGEGVGDGSGVGSWDELD